MFARITGAVLGLLLALGATAVTNPDGQVMSWLTDVTGAVAQAQEGNAGR